MLQSAAEPGDEIVLRGVTQEPSLPEPISNQPPSPAQRQKPIQSHPIEQKILRKLARGRHKIDSRIDLHGMTQDEARESLIDFLLAAQRMNKRMVLVITGKGNNNLGVLRRAVPQWLRLPVLAGVVNGVEEAHVSHGGAGALYVRVRRPLSKS